MTPVDLYCERVDPGLFGEPLNALSNAAMFIAALLAWRDARRAGEIGAGLWLLIGLVVAFGTGSTLFHTFANVITLWLDVLPIAAFIATYLWLYLRRVVGASAPTAWLAVTAYVAAAIVAREFRGVLNGSITYAPALLLVLGLGVTHWLNARPERGTLLAAAAVFVAALTFRTVDNNVCAALPTGTHFMWHLLAAGAVYLAMRALTATMPGARTLSPSGREFAVLDKDR